MCYKSRGGNSSGSKTIHSKEYVKSGEEDSNYPSQTDDVSSLKHRLLNEKESYTDYIVIQNNDEDLIMDHNISSFVRDESDINAIKDIKSYYSSNSEKSNQEQQDCEKFHILNNTDLGKTTPELYPNKNEDEEEDDEDEPLESTAKKASEKDLQNDVKLEEYNFPDFADFNQNSETQLYNRLDPEYDEYE